MVNLPGYTYTADIVMRAVVLSAGKEELNRCASS